MPSPLQYAANRLNAEESQGPTSPEGRARSSMNALRHGLTARVVVLPTEDMAAYRAFSKEIVDSLDPQTPVERQFAQTVADNQWRINRIRSIEDGMLGMGHYEAVGDFNTDHPEFHSAMTSARAFRDGSKAFVNLSIYEQRLHRTMKEALRQLKELQTERRERQKAEMDDAIRLRKTRQMKSLPFDPAEAAAQASVRCADGIRIVYSSAEIAREASRRDHIDDSKRAKKAAFNLAEYSCTAGDLVTGDFPQGKHNGQPCPGDRDRLPGASGQTGPVRPPMNPTLHAPGFPLS